MSFASLILAVMVVPHDRDVAARADRIVEILDRRVVTEEAGEGESPASVKAVQG